MTQVREPLSMLDNGSPSCDFRTKTIKGFFVSKSLGLVIFIIYILSIVATALIVYNFVACPQANKLPNLQKNELQTIQCSTEKSIELLQTSNVSPKNLDLHPTSTTEIPNEESNTNLNQHIYLRLPRSIKPEKYNIKLTPYLTEGNFTFHGEVEIVINITEKTNNITLHGSQLNIKKIDLHLYHKGAKKKKISISSHIEDVLRQFHILTPSDQLKAGELYLLYIQYVGYLNDNLHGFYRSSYIEKNNTRWIATTQFQPTDARLAFPCFDEPALKARFTVSIARPRHMTSISNMDLKGASVPHDILPDYMWDHYKESLPMSTYLVAFVVSDFEKISKDNISVWARRSAISSAKYALEVATNVLKFCEDFYKIKFPLPKIDMIALPDFNAGAMENWGLLTFRETAMLYEEGLASRESRARVASVVSHELAHQWFGNLVTPAWWSDLWLNEGFASYVEYIGVNEVEHSWKSMEQFVIHEVQNVFSLDALSTSHPISVEVDNPNEINEIFDRISYGKGAAIIRMMNHFLTDKVFNKGVTNYLNSKKFSNAESNDLWQALTNEARISNIFDEETSVKVIMDTWTLQTGFPVITVSRNNATKSVTFNQDHFLLINDTKNDKKSFWWVPISYTTSSEKNFNLTKPSIWLRGDKEITVHNVSLAPDDWIIANIQQTGFYRVNYDIHNWRLIINYLNDKDRFQDISPINRAQLVDDAMNLALGGRLDYKLALDVTKYLFHERSYVPWKAGLVAMGYIDSMLAKGPNYLEYRKHVLSLMEGMFRSVGFAPRPGEGMAEAHARADVLAAACQLEHPACVGHAARAFHAWMMTPNPDVHNDIPADIRGCVYCAALAAGGAREWSFAWQRFLTARASSERELLLAALGCTRTPWLLNRYLDYAVRNNTGIRKQDIYRVFIAVSNSVIGQPVAFAFVRTNWQRLKEYFGASPTSLNTMFKVVTKRLNQPHELAELKKFERDHRNEFGRTLDQAIERTEANIQWMQRNSQTIVDWLLDPANELQESNLMDDS